MNRKFLIGALIFAAVLAAAFFFFLPQSPFYLNKTAVNTNQTDDSSDNSTESLFMQAFTGGESMKCTYTDDGNTSTAYIKKGKIRVNSAGVDGKEFGNAIIDGNIVYAWQVGSSEGMKIDTTTYGDNPVGTVEGVMDAEKIKQIVEESKPECVKEAISDDLFVPPTTVTFKDISAFMQQAVPTGASEEDYKKLLEQYQQ